jgi:hypothetical protein
MGDIHLSSRRGIILRNGQDFDSWDGWFRSECHIHNVWGIIAGTEPRPIPHPPKQKSKPPPQSSTSNFKPTEVKKKEKEKVEVEDEDQYSEDDELNMSFLEGEATSKKTKVLFSLSGVNLGYGALETIDQGLTLSDILDQMAIFLGTINPDVTDEQREKRKKKIKKWDK